MPQSGQMFEEKENATGETVSPLEELPEDVVNQVIEHLDPFEYLSFRAVSRRCRSVAPLKQYYSVLDNHISSPWLIFPAANHKSAFSIVDPRFGLERECNVKFPLPVPEDARIRYCKHGWLLMSHVRTLFLFNPLTKHEIPLPEVEDRDVDVAFFLPANSESSDDFIVFVASYNNDATLPVIRPRGLLKDWFNMRFGELFSVLSDTILIGATLYAELNRGKISVTRMEDPDSTVNVPVDESYKESYLVSCDGELLAVHVGEAGKLVKVFKLPGLGHNNICGVTEVKDLGNNCLYLSKLSSFAVNSETPGKKNRIYFARFYAGSMIYYSMDTCKLHYSWLREGSIVEESLDDFDGSNEQYLDSACWFEPRWHLQQEPTADRTCIVTWKR